MSLEQMLLNSRDLPRALLNTVIKHFLMIDEFVLTMLFLRPVVNNQGTEIEE